MGARLVALVVGAVAAALLLASAGAGLAMQLGSQKGGGVILSPDVDRATIQKVVEARRAELRRENFARLVQPGNKQALLRYLRRHTDIDLSRAVFQRGARNYAGPNCPGPAWNCTSARQVVQISANGDDNGGGGNTFRCTGALAPGPSCVVVQFNVLGTNSAECVQRTNDMPVVILTCEITQTNTNGANRAYIEQDANHSSSGLIPQNVRETADLNQTNVNGSNYADVVQDVDLAMSGSADQMQDAHQRAELDLIATLAGNNTANVRQTQDLDANQTAADVDQRQNTLRDTVANCVTSEEPEAPNSCARVFMDTGSGNNNLDLDQANNLNMTVGGGDDDNGDDGGDDNGDDGGDDNGDDGGDDNGDDGGDDNGDDDNGGSSSVDGVQQQGFCESADEPCGFGDDPDGGTEAGIEMFSDSGDTTSHMSGLASADMPGNTPLITQLQFTDPWCCFSTTFAGTSPRSEIDLRAFMDAGEDSYQTGENGLGCIAQGGLCVAFLSIRTEDGTFDDSEQGPILFANQQCTHGGVSSSQVGPPQCSNVQFTTTTTTTTIPPPD